MFHKRIARTVLCVIAIAAIASASAHAADPVAATQNTITTTGPVTSDTVISLGTLAGQVLTWVMAVFGVPVGTLLTAWLYRLFTKAGVDITDAMRDRLQQMVVNGLNIGAATATTELAGKGQIAIKNRAIQRAVLYVQEHGAQELKAMGINPTSNIAVDAINARIQTAITDANTPTPKILDAVVPAAIPSVKEMTK
jgi:hypothetical protein